MKTNLNKTLAFLVNIATILTISSCKRESGGNPESNISIYNIPQDFKDYFYFAPGSYWIYENQRNHSIDSVYIVSRNSTNTLDPSRKIKQETIFIQYYDSYYGVLFENYTKICPTCVDDLTNFRYSLTLASKSGFPTGGGGYSLMYKARVGLKIDQVLNPIEIKSISDSIIYDGKTYTDVIRLYTKSSILFNDRETQIYYLKNFGIVRKTDLTKNDDWVLIRCNIIK